MANATVEALEKKLVEGLKFRIESAELSKLMKDRADYHEQRASHKKEELPKLKANLESLVTSPKVSAVSNKLSGYNMNPSDVVEQVETDIKNHENKVQSLRFLADHVVPNVAYILTENDLRSLEVIK